MSLTIEYLFFVFIAACGVLQLAAALNQLKGMMFFRKAAASYIFAVLAIGGAFGWFFGWNRRLDVKIMLTGLEGAQQLYYFCLAALAALVFTLIVSSLVNYRSLAKAKPPEETEPGLEALRDRTYSQAIRQSFKREKEENDSDSSRG